VFKPSSRALPTALLIEDCVKRAGLANNILQVAVAQSDAALALALHDGIDGVFFSGSTQVGQTLARKIAERPGKLLSLDLGGNNAIVVWDTPQIEDAAMMVVQSAFTASGQRASCARRLIVRDTMAEPLLAEIKRLADRIICGSPWDETTPFMGPATDRQSRGGWFRAKLHLVDVEWWAPGQTYGSPSPTPALCQPGHH
jgi:succinylglutamic semialdehyde dehydrogenase